MKAKINGELEIEIANSKTTPDIRIKQDSGYNNSVWVYIEGRPFIRIWEDGYLQYFDKDNEIHSDHWK